MKLKFKNGQIEISDIIMNKIIDIINSENSLYDCLDDFFQSALRKEIILNIREQFSKEFMERFKEFEKEK